MKAVEPQTALQVLALSPVGFPNPRLAHAAALAGFEGGVALETLASEARFEAVVGLRGTASRFTLSLEGESGDLSELVKQAGPGLTRVVLTGPVLPENLSLLEEAGVVGTVEILAAHQAAPAIAAGAKALLVKGSESGGLVGEETTFILLQQVLPVAGVPVYARGGIGLHTASACLAAGAAGVVLDWQLALAEEANLPEAVRSKVGRMDGSETGLLGQGCSLRFRAYARPGEKAYFELKDFEEKQALSAASDPALLSKWNEMVVARVARHELLLVGQDACFAAPLAQKHRTVASICREIRRQAFRQLRVACRKDVLREGGPLAASHGMRYPILQGPMTRVSDRADFAKAVAVDGALPFLALALLRGPQVNRLLAETQEKLGSLPWGVGILGFVPKELRDEQLEEVKKFKPPFAIIAGGRPDMAKQFERDGMAAYLHVPSPELLRNFLEQGARRIIFEGRECGGHVGPRSSWVLWDAMIRVILAHLGTAGAGKPEEYHFAFAGGIHDTLSAAMTSAIIAPLSERGVRAGVLLGTGYLFTEEAVSTGAITAEFQRQAVACQETILVESGVGHATRCANTPFGQLFSNEKQKLLAEGRPKEEIRERLEGLNLGRLRIASKGIERRTGPDGKAVYETLDDATQRSEGMFMIGQVAALRERVTTVRALHEEVARAGEFLRGRLETISRVTMAGRPEFRDSDIAIVGFSAIFPEAGNSDTFWQNILHKRCAITEVPKERWDLDVYFDADRRTRDKVYSRWGGFIGDFEFDPLRFGMPPNTLRSIEPMQLVMLEMVQRALADAGYAERPFNRRETACIVGTGGGVAEMGQAYGFRAMLPHFIDRAGGTLADSEMLIEKLGDHLPEWTEDSFAGLLLNVVSGRVANRFDFGGTNYIVDAACATALAALRGACTELENRSSEVVVAASSDLMQTAFGYLCFSKTQALSPTGQCRTFDETADGIVISEGCVVAILKRLDDAVMDGDRIYSVIKSVGASSDGKDKGLTAPRPIGQMRALERAYEKAGIDPCTVDLIEAHGTGTVVGDRSESEALTTFFAGRGAGKASIALGSVKSMVGHTKCSAGFAGLVKAALALHYQVLPPTIGVTKPNSKAKLGDAALYVNTEPRPWLRRLDGAPRRAGVSAFGFGGTNFHTVLEEWVNPEAPSHELSQREWPAELFLFRGKDGAAVSKAMGAVAASLAAGSKPALWELASAVYWEHGRAAAPVCAALVATSLEDLAAKLVAAQAAASAGTALRDPNGIYFSPEPSFAEGKVAFLFPGQGSQRTNMLRDLAVVFPVVRRAFEEADAALSSQLGQPLSRFIFPVPEFTEEAKKANEAALKATEVAQPALGAADLAMFALLQSLGIHPAMAAGHSYGEFAALSAAGAMSHEDLIRVSELRGRAIVESAQNGLGTMAAVEGNEMQVAQGIQGLPDVWIANLNSPLQTVISGSLTGVEAAASKLAGLGLNVRQIPVACAFHSELVAGAKQPLAEGLSQIEWSEPRFPIYSNTLARPHTPESGALRDILVEHLVKPVRFADEIGAMYQGGARVFIECGPGAVLSKLTTAILGDKPHVTIPMDQASRPGLVQLVHALAQCAIAGVSFYGTHLFEGRAEKWLPLAELLKVSLPAPIPASTWVVRNGRAVTSAEYQKILSTGFHPGNDAGRNDPTPMLLKDFRNQKEFSSPVPAQVAPVAVAVSQQPKPVFPTREVVMQDPNDNQMIRTTPSSNGRNGHSQPMTPLAGTILEEALQGHHRLMGRFLDTHRVVMSALLGSGDLNAPASENGQYRMDSGPAPAMIAAPAVHRPMPQQHQPQQMSQPVMAPAPVAAQPVAVAQPIAVAVPVPVAAAPAAAVPVAAPAPTAVATVPAPVSVPAPVAAAAAAPAKITRAVIEEKLVALVAQRTGYPPEMLGLDLDLEADLGVDSIKRFEILGALQNESLISAAAMESEVENLAKLNTLSAIAGFIEAKANEASGGGANGAAATPAPERAAAQAVGSVTRMSVQLENAKPQEDSSLPFAQAVLISHDGHGIAELIANKFDAAGVPSRIVKTFTEAEAARQELGRLSHIVHLAPLAAPPEDPIGGMLPRFDSDVKLLYQMTRQFAKDLHDSPGALILGATRLGGAFGFGGTAPDYCPASGGVAGFLKTVSREWTHLRARCVDFEFTATPDSIANVLWSELRYTDGYSEVGYLAGQRVTPASVKTPLTAQPSPLRLDRESVVLLTGGARGITADIALELAKAYQPKLVLVGRSVLPDGEPREIAAAKTDAELKAVIIDKMTTVGQRPTPGLVQGELRRIKQNREIRANFAALEAAGSKIEYHAVNVCDAAAFGAVIDQTYAKYGRLDGAVHAAGVIEDKLIEDKTPESFDRVTDPKIKGAQLLAQKLRPEGLQFLVLFSSVSARYGNRGQCDYAAANEVLNKLAYSLNSRWPGRVVSLDWGPWKTEGGMVSPQLAERFAKAGVEMIEPPAGRKAFLDELLYGTKADSEVVFGGPLTLAQQRPAQQPQAVEISGSVETLVVLNTQNDLYLLDHVIDRRPVLPMAMAIELMAGAAAGVWKSPVKTIRDARALKGVLFPETGGEIVLELDAVRTASGTIDVTLRSRDKKFLHYNATVELGTPEQTPPSQPLHLIDPQPLPVSRDEAYRDWLFHGPLFAGIASVEAVGRNGIIGSLETTPSTKLFADHRAHSWITDPVLVDSGLQLIILWSRVTLGKMVLPAGLKAYHRYAPLPTSGPVRCEVSIANESPNPLVRCQLRFYSPKGECLAWMEDMDVTANAALNRLFKSETAVGVR